VITTNIPEMEAPPIEDIAFSKLLAYCKMIFPKFEISLHHKYIAYYLQEIEKGTITRLMINMPPRSGKTFLVQHFIAWYLGRNPTNEVIYASYSSDRGTDIGRECRNIMLSDVHAQIFPQGRLASDAKASSKFSTIGNGHFYGVGYGGALSGRGCHVGILDDLVKDRVDDQSETNNRKRREWFTSTFYTRLREGNAGIIAIGTRWSYGDFLGYLKDDLAHENWVILDFPALAEENDILGREPGEALWPTRYPKEKMLQYKKTLTPLDWSALYQQRPIPSEGGMVHMEWFQRYDMQQILELRSYASRGVEVPIVRQFFHRIVISIDSASKTTAVHDQTAITVWGQSKDNQNHYLIDCIFEKVEFPELLRLVNRIYEKYKKWNMGTPRVLCEDRSSGIALIQHLRKTSRIPIIPVNPCKSKELRMEDAAVHIESGKVWLPEQAAWLHNVEEQVSQFPLGRYRDICDSISQYLNYQFGKRFKRSKITGYIR